MTNLENVKMLDKAPVIKDSVTELCFLELFKCMCSCLPLGNGNGNYRRRSCEMKKTKTGNEVNMNMM
jgi:hypothetical protein